MNVTLVVVQGKPEGMSIPVKGPQFTIGRDPKCNLRPNNELVSKLHCALQLLEDKVIIRDIESTNGTFVNGEKVTGKRELRDGDLVKIATLVFTVKIERTAPVAAKPIAPAAIPPSVEPAATIADAALVTTLSNGDDPMQWLMTDAVGGTVAEPSQDSTIMDLRLVADVTETVADKRPLSEGERNPLNKKHESRAPKPATADTREAAAAILNQYLVRRRI